MRGLRWCRRRGGLWLDAVPFKRDWSFPCHCVHFAGVVVRCGSVSPPLLGGCVTVFTGLCVAMGHRALAFAEPPSVPYYHPVVFVIESLVIAFLFFDLYVQALYYGAHTAFLGARNKYV